jgi:hypothetical protein
VKISRRDFIHTGCAAAAVTLAPHFLDVAEARFIHGSSGQVSGFNNKLLQTNPNFLLGGGDYPWLNAAKGAQQWGFSNNADAPVTPDLLDANGYLISASGNAAGGVATVFFIPSQAQRPGPYIYAWTGNGSVGHASANANPLAYAITSVTQSGTIQTVTLLISPQIIRHRFVDMSNRA